MADPDRELPDPSVTEPRSRRGRRLLRLAAVVMALAGLALAGCGGDDEETTSTTTDAGCEQVEAPAPKDLDLQAPKADAPTATGVAFVTSCGSFEISFDDRSPMTAASFEYLAVQGAFDGTVFHRVIAGQLIQGGDPLGSDPDPAIPGTGGPGYFVDERPPGNLSYTEGTVAMAKTTAEPIGRSGSQFFVVVGADLGLTPDYALVGEVSSGLEVVEAISEQGQPGADGPPTMPVVIETATPIDESGG